MVFILWLVGQQNINICTRSLFLDGQALLGQTEAILESSQEQPTVKAILKKLIHLWLTHFLRETLWATIDQVTSKSQRTQGNKERKGISVPQRTKRVESFWLSNQ